MQHSVLFTWSTGGVHSINGMNARFILRSQTITVTRPNNSTLPNHTTVLCSSVFFMIKKLHRSAFDRPNANVSNILRCTTSSNKLESADTMLLCNSWSSWAGAYRPCSQPLFMNVTRLLISFVRTTAPKIQSVISLANAFMVSGRDTSSKASQTCAPAGDLFVYV